MEWFEIEIELSPAVVDAISQFLFDQGALGVTELGTEKVPLLKAYFESEATDRVKKSLEIYCKELETIFPTEKKVVVRYGNIKDFGWGEKYKEFYKAQKLSHEFFLLPEWDKTTKVPASMIPIRMEPGQAFGTGLHPSTRLCLRLIEYVFEKSFRPETIKAIDIGTGSGILAIAVQKLGASEVVGTDIDPVAIETAKENVVLNGCKPMNLSTQPTSDFKKPYDLVIANILLETHLQLATEYKRLTKAGGFLIVSGLLGQQRNETVELLENNGFGLIVSEAFQEWAAFLFARRGEP